MSMRSSLGRVRGLGSAKEGVQHWWMQRLTAVALVPLSLWFAFSVAVRAGGDHAVYAAWLAQPINSILALLLTFAVFSHAKLGLEVVVEDYVHDKGVKFATLIIVRFLAIGLGVATAFSILKVAFGG